MKLKYESHSAFADDLEKLEKILDEIKAPESTYSKAEIKSLIRHMAGQLEVIQFKMRLPGEDYFWGVDDA